MTDFEKAVEAWDEMEQWFRDAEEEYEEGVYAIHKYREAHFNFEESMKDNGLDVTPNAQARFDNMFNHWIAYEGTEEDLYGDDFMDGGLLYSLVQKLVDENERG